MNEHENGAVQEIDLISSLLAIWKVLRKRLVWVVLICLVVGGAMGARRYLSYRPVYQSQAILAVDPAASDIMNLSGYYNSSSTTKQLISTFPTLLSTDAMREELLAILKTPSIRGSISAKNIANSNLFSLSVTSSDPQDAYDVLNAVITAFPLVAVHVVGNTELTLIEAPVKASAPSNSRVWLPTAVKWSVAALAAQILLLFLFVQTHQMLSSTDQIKRISNITCLGHLPRVKPKKSASKRIPIISIQNKNVPDSYREAVRTLRTRVTRGLRSANSNTLLITSTLSGEGKSTVVANLALALSAAGHSVILVDADLRVQSLRKFFKLSAKSSGLGELLNDSAAPAVSVLQEIPGTTIRLMSSSTSIPNPTGLLTTKRLSRVIQELEGQAEFILIDTPPIGMLSDASALLQLVGQVLYVVREDYITSQQFTEALQHVSDTNANILGYAFNCVSGSAGLYGYGRYGYGKYGYGKYGYGSYSGYSRYKSDN